MSCRRCRLLWSCPPRWTGSSLQRTRREWCASATWEWIIVNYIDFTEFSSYFFCVAPQPLLTDLISETKPSFSVSILKEARWKSTDSTFMLTLHCPTSSAATGSCPHLHSKPPSGMGTPTVERERTGRFHWQFPSSLQKGGKSISNRSDQLTWRKIREYLETN